MCITHNSILENISLNNLAKRNCNEKYIYMSEDPACSFFGFALLVLNRENQDVTVTVVHNDFMLRLSAWKLVTIWF